MATRLCERVATLVAHVAPDEAPHQAVYYAALYAVASACSAIRRDNGALCTRRRCRHAAEADIPSEEVATVVAVAVAVSSPALEATRLSAWAKRDALVAMQTGHASLATSGFV